MINTLNGTGDEVSGGPDGSLTMIGDADPNGDMCSTTSGEVFNMSGQNIGNLLDNANITWGWFEGGFNLGLTNSNGTNYFTVAAAVTGAKFYRLIYQP